MPETQNYRRTTVSGIKLIYEIFCKVKILHTYVYFVNEKCTVLHIVFSKMPFTLCSLDIFAGESRDGLSRAPQLHTQGPRRQELPRWGGECCQGNAERSRVSGKDILIHILHISISIYVYTNI